MPRHGGHVQGYPTAPVIIGRVRNAHTGHPAFAIWCKEIDAVLGTGTCARTSPTLLHALYDQGLPSSRAAAQIIMPRAMVGGCELTGGQPEIVGGLEIVGRGNVYEIVGRRGTLAGQRTAPPRGGGGGGGGAAPRPSGGGRPAAAAPRPAPGGGGGSLSTRPAPGPGSAAPRGTAPSAAFSNVVPTPSPAPPPAALQNVNPSGLQNPSGAWTGHGGHGGHGHGRGGGGWWGGGWGWGWPWPWPYPQQPQQPNDLSAIAAELNACGALSVNMDSMGNLVLTSHDPATTRSCVGTIYRGYPVIVQPA